METKHKIIMGISAAVLLTAVIILIIATKKKNDGAVPVTAPTSVPTATPTPTPAPEPTDEPAPITIEDMFPSETPTPTEEPPKEMTEEEKLIYQLLNDPFNENGGASPESVTVRTHSEQSANLDKYNTYFIDVADRLEAQGVEYIPMTLTYDAEREYVKDGFRTWSNSESSEDGSHGGGKAEIYDFAKGTVHCYSYISNKGYYKDEGTVKTDITPDDYFQKPKYDFSAMFAENLPPVLTETDDEYILKGTTTSDGYTASVPSETFPVTHHPMWKFQYLLDVTLRYDKQSMLIKSMYVEVVGKVSHPGNLIKQNDPLAEKVETEIGLKEGTFLQTDFTGYGTTKLTKLEGNVFFEVEQEEAKEPTYPYTFMDGSVISFTADEWNSLISKFLQSAEGEDGLADVVKEIMAVKSSYVGKYTVIEEFPESRKLKRYADKDKGKSLWKTDVEEWKKLAKDAASLPEEDRITITEALGVYERTMTGIGYYRAPVNGYLCSLLLDKDGKIVKELARDGYLGLEYAAMLDIATHEFMEICGKQCGYSFGSGKIEMLRDALVNSGIWDKISYGASASDLARIEKTDYPETIIEESSITAARKLIHDDIRKRTEEKLKAMAKKMHIGT